MSRGFKKEMIRQAVGLVFFFLKKLDPTCCGGSLYPGWLFSRVHRGPAAASRPDPSRLPGIFFDCRNNSYLACCYSNRLVTQPMANQKRRLFQLLFKLERCLTPGLL